MIVPVRGLQKFTFFPPTEGDLVYLVKEEYNPWMEYAVAVYNSIGQKLGYVTCGRTYNRLVRRFLKYDLGMAKVWMTERWFLLVEIK
jgi:hypothetical protein